jgi:hypothetical protein
MGGDDDDDDNKILRQNYGRKSHLRLIKLNFIIAISSPHNVSLIHTLFNLIFLQYVLNLGRFGKSNIVCSRTFRPCFIIWIKLVYFAVNPNNSFRYQKRSLVTRLVSLCCSLLSAKISTIYRPSSMYAFNNYYCFKSRI